jgi:hypothetical protein
MEPPSAAQNERQFRLTVKEIAREQDFFMELPSLPSAARLFPGAGCSILWPEGTANCGHEPLAATKKPMTLTGARVAGSPHSATFRLARNSRLETCVFAAGDSQREPALQQEQRSGS